MLNEVMRKYNCKTFVFSSSLLFMVIQIYSYKENHPLSATNPYSRSKTIIEEFLRDMFVLDNKNSFGILRYFNPIGAHKSGLIGEDPMISQTI